MISIKPGKKFSECFFFLGRFITSDFYCNSAEGREGESIFIWCRIFSIKVIKVNRGTNWQKLGKKVFLKEPILQGVGCPL